MPTISPSIPHLDVAHADPYQRGLTVGLHLTDQIANTVSVYGRLFEEDVGLSHPQVLALGRRIAKTLDLHRPALMTELRGMAEGCRQPVEVLAAINARTEILCGGVIAGAARGECSLVSAVTASGTSAVMAQNWDFHPDLGESRVVIRLGHDSGWLTTFTEAGLLAKIGLNSHGVALGINFLSSSLDGNGPGVPVHVLLRMILMEARCLEDARHLVRTTSRSASVSITVAGPCPDGNYDTLALEAWPGGVNEIPSKGKPRHVIHTNHFVSDIAAEDVFANGPQGRQSLSRYEQLERGIRTGGEPRLKELTDLLSSRSCPPDGQELLRSDDPKRPWLERSATLATIGLSVPDARITVTDPLL